MPALKRSDWVCAIWDGSKDRLLGNPRSEITASLDHLHLQTHELGGKLWEMLKSCFGVTQLDYEIFAFNESRLTQSFAKRLKAWRSWGRGGRPQNTHPAYVLRRLGARRERPRRRTTDKRYELAPPHCRPREAHNGAS